jgi:hypothetical protein
MYASDKAWIVLGAGVLLWDLAAAEGQTLSEGADRYMDHHPWVTRSVGVALVAHVCNFLPNRWDPVHGLFVLSRRWRRLNP